MELSDAEPERAGWISRAMLVRPSTRIRSASRNLPFPDLTWSGMLSCLALLYTCFSLLSVWLISFWTLVVLLEPAAWVSVVNSDLPLAADWLLSEETLLA